MTGLLGSTVLEVAIGIALIYLLLAIFCTTVNEWIAALFNTRSNMLKQGIEQLLGPDSAQKPGPNSVLQQFYNHPLIQALLKNDEHPSYIPARTFAKTIMDIATPNHPGSISFEDLENGIKTDLPDSAAKRSLLAVIQGAEKNIEGGQQAIEAWYNDGMDRVSGWYKRRTQLWTALVAIVITVAVNADTVQLVHRLWTEPGLRSALDAAAKSQTSSAITDQATQILGPILGWSGLKNLDDPAGWFTRIVGWIFTILAVSLGAPFWFDVLNRFMNVRSAGKSPEERAKPPEKPKMPAVTA